MLRKKEAIRQAHRDLISSGPTWLRKSGQLGLSQPCKAGSQRWWWNTAASSRLSNLSSTSGPAALFCHIYFSMWFPQGVRGQRCKGLFGSSPVLKMLLPPRKQPPQNRGKRHKTKELRKNPSRDGGEVHRGHRSVQQRCQAGSSQSLRGFDGEHWPLSSTCCQCGQTAAAAAGGWGAATNPRLFLLVPSAPSPAGTSWLGCFDCRLAVAGIYKHHPNYSSP